MDRRGVGGSTKELQQHHDMTTFVPIDGTKLSRKERTDALGALMFITQKRDGTVKAKDKCADGGGQRGTISNAEHCPEKIPQNNIVD